MWYNLVTMDDVSSAWKHFIAQIASRQKAEQAGMSDRIVALSAKHEQLLLKEPFETAKRRALASDTVIVELITEKGIVGRGAATPVQYITGETVESVITAVDTTSKELIGDELIFFTDIIIKLKMLLCESPSARAAIESAILDAYGKICGKPVYEILGGAEMVFETDVTIPVVIPKYAAELAIQATARGFRKFKVKVSGKNDNEDLARALSISQAVLGSSLIVDANQGFQPNEAIDFIHRLVEEGAKIDVFEQPVDKSDIEGFAHVTKNANVPVFADESVLTVEDLIKLAKQKAISGVNIKLMKSGFFGALEIAMACKMFDLDLMLGCMLEPRFGISSAIHLACISNGFMHFDLDADLLLVDQSTGGYVREGALIRPIGVPGLGFLPEC
jgi:L-alanine-DL-glutamate epimerase-like enolase superfamily enzyme